MAAYRKEHQTVKRIHVILAALAALALSAALIAASAQGAALGTKTLKGTVGPGFTITLKTKSGKKVKTLKAGRYTIKIADKSNFHNFHLKGPGVDKKTSVSFVGHKTWHVRFKKGKKYKYVCDIHLTTMHGKFKVR
jgi:plastocyanin